MHSSWDTDHNRHIFCHFGPFFALLPPQPFHDGGRYYIETSPSICEANWLTWKIESLKKKLKSTWRYHFIHVYHKWQSHDVQFLRYEAGQIFFLILHHFSPFTTLNNLENLNFEKMKKTNVYPEAYPEGFLYQYRPPNFGT